MKIKRTKPGTKHEIVKSGENGERQTGGHGGAKRGSSSHRREKKHSGSGTGNEKTVTSGTSTASSNVSSNGKEGVNGLVRVVTYPVSGSTQQQSAPAVQTAEQPHQLLVSNRAGLPITARQSKYCDREVSGSAYTRKAPMPKEAHSTTEHTHNIPVSHSGMRELRRARSL